MRIRDLNATTTVKKTIESYKTSEKNYSAVKQRHPKKPKQSPDKQTSTNNGAIIFEKSMTPPTGSAYNSKGSPYHKINI